MRQYAYGEIEEDMKLVNVRDRCGLWKIKSPVCEIFMNDEMLFKNMSKLFFRSIPVNDIVEKLSKTPSVLANYSIICLDSQINVDEEYATNLLENMLLLYIKIRAFSYPKDKIQSHKIRSKQLKKKSLRTEIKKSTFNLNQGH